MPPEAGTLLARIDEIKTKHKFPRGRDEEGVALSGVSDVYQDVISETTEAIRIRQPLYPSTYIRRPFFVLRRRI